MVVQLTVHNYIRGVSVYIHSLTHFSFYRFAVVSHNFQFVPHLTLLPLVVLSRVLDEGVVLVSVGVLQGLHVLGPPHPEGEARLAGVGGRHPGPPVLHLLHQHHAALLPGPGLGAL